MRGGDDLAYSHAFGKLDRRDVTRICKRMHQGDRAFKGVVVVVRGVGSDGGGKGNRRVDNYFFRTGAFLHRSGVDVGLEGRSCLPLGLGGTVELRQVEITAT